MYPRASLDLLNQEVIPDITLLEPEELDYTEDELMIKKIPFLVAEIESTIQTIGDIKDKISKIYTPAGVKSIWLVVPSLKTVSLVLPNGQFQTITGGVVKDLYLDIELNMAEIFR